MYIGGKLSKGLLRMGPRGTGKTLLGGCLHTNKIVPEAFHVVNSDQINCAGDFSCSVQLAPKQTN